MLVYFSFDDAVTLWTNSFLKKLFADNRQNPNGCPITATHFNSYNYTDYSIVRDLYDKGHELASHSISHRQPPEWWAQATKEQWREEIAGQRDVIHQLAGIPVKEIRGMRAPFLQIGADRQFDMLKEEGFTFDASMVAITDPPSWPFTLQYPQDLTTGVCMIQPCPNQPYDLWEVPLNVLYMDSPFTPECSMVDGCRPNNKEEALKFLWDNFYRYYNASSKPPFGLNMHAAWFAWQFNADAMDEFIQKLVELPDVWIVPIYKVLQWIQQPTPLAQLKNFPPFQC